MSVKFKLFETPTDRISLSGPIGLLIELIIILSLFVTLLWFNMNGNVSGWYMYSACIMFVWCAGSSMDLSIHLFFRVASLSYEMSRLNSVPTIHHGITMDLKYSFFDVYIYKIKSIRNEKPKDFFLITNFPIRRLESVDCAIHYFSNTFIKIF